MKRTVLGILAHVDAGKTTCIESMLYHSGVTRRMGRVDTKDAAMDTDPQERSHGITIYAKEARITWKDTTINLIDTPGHVDFSQEMERALSVIDLAVVLISGLDGTQAHTETIMSLLAHYDIPVLFFVNKMDISKRSEEELFQELEETFHNCVRWN
jgi:small GTP-binding protein